VRRAQNEAAEGDSDLFRLIALPPGAGVRGLRTAITGRLCQEDKEEEDDSRGLRILLLPDVVIETDADVLLLRDGDRLEVANSI
jgi:hypothetical protein